MALTRIYEGVWPSGVRVRFRALTLAEHAKFSLDLRSGVPPVQVYLDLYEEVLVSGPVPDEVPAGIVVWIGRELLDRSCLSGEQQLIKQKLDQKRQAARNYLMAAKAFVAMVFHYKFEEMDSWDEDTLFERIALAELVLGRPLEPSDQNATTEQQAPKRRGRR